MQDSGLTEIIPLIFHLISLGPVSCIFTSWVSWGLTVESSCSLMAARQQIYSFLPEFAQGSPVLHPQWLQLLITVTSFVYWYGRTYSILASLIAQLVNAGQEIPVRFLGWEIRWRRDRLPTPVFFGFPGGSAGKEPACNMGDSGSIPGLGRSPGERNGYPPQYSGMENPMDYRLCRITKSLTWLSDFPFPFHSIFYGHEQFTAWWGREPCL